MRPTAATTLTPRQRLTRGLSHTASGPVDVTRGVLGIGVGSARAGASHLRQRYRDSRLAHEVAGTPELVAQDVAAVQEVIAGLPDVLQQARRAQRRSWRPLVVTGVAAVLVAGGAAAALILRRSAQAEQSSPRPPSVDVQPRP